MSTHQTKKYNTWALRGDFDADWHLSYANRFVFELGDAASILANVQPEYPGKLDAVCLAEISKWVETLKANVHELLSQSGYNEKDPLHHRLSHEKLRVWCSISGISWPIPESVAGRVRDLEQQLVDERNIRIREMVQDDVTLSPPVLLLNEPEEVYRHLDYLTESQALNWMGRISGLEVPHHTLWAMAELKICRAFMDCRSMKGITHPLDGDHEHRQVYGLGVCQVMNPFPGRDAPTYLLGPAIHVDEHGYQDVEARRNWWIEYPENYELLFRPSDIERAGSMLNADGGWSNEGQLSNIEENHATLPDIAYGYSAEWREGAPGESCDNEAAKAYEVEMARLRGLLVEQAALLERLQQDKHATMGDKPAGITFPYTTVELEAMRAVALKHWAFYTHDKRQPTQKEVGYYLCEILGLKRQSNDSPARKAEILATAIRPDSIPDMTG